MLKVHGQLIGMPLTFMVGNHFNAKDYTVKDVVLVRGDGKVPFALFGKITGKGKTHYPVIIFRGGGDVEYFCGFSPDLKTRLQELKLLVPELEAFLTDAKASSHQCWRRYQTPPPRFGVKGREAGCKHGLLLARAYEQQGGKEIILAPSVASSVSVEDEYSRRIRALSFREHVLIVGEPGCGKTHVATEVADLVASELKTSGFDAQVFFLQGNSSVEGISLLGNMVKTKSGKVRLKPGKLFWAFKFASWSPYNKAVIVLDEVFRIPPREQSVIISALTEVRKNGRVYHHLQHPDDAKAEVWVPKERIWVIATGNLGGNFKYSVASDPAMLDRFATIWMRLTPEKLASVIQPILSAKGWSELLQPLLNLRAVAEEFARRGELSVVPSLRTFLMLAHAERPEDIIPFLSARFPASSLEEWEVWEQVLNKVLAPAIKSLS